MVGSEIRIEDTGLLSVSSTRICFLENRKTVDIPYTKLAGLGVDSDGVTLQSSLRDGKFSAGFQENGRWRMRTLKARA